MANETQAINATKQSDAKLTPAEKVLKKEKAQKAKVRLTPSEKLLARERALRGDIAALNPQDVASGKAYRRADTESGVLTNPQEIELCKALQKKDIFTNGLLGAYDDEGNYVISEDIRKELVRVNKTSGESFEDTYYAISRSETDPYKTLKFSVQIEKVDEDTKTATLKVLEEIEQLGGLYNNTVATFIAEYTDTDTEEFTTRAFELFNIIRLTDNMTNFLIEDLAPKTMRRKINLKGLFERYLSGDLTAEEGEMLESKLRRLDGGSKESGELRSQLESAMKQLEQLRPDRVEQLGTNFLKNCIFETLIDNLIGNLPVKGLLAQTIDAKLQNLETDLLRGENLIKESSFGPRRQFFENLQQQTEKTKEFAGKFFDKGKEM